MLYSDELQTAQGSTRGMAYLNWDLGPLHYAEM
jgi:hypothetical protein